MVYNLLLEKFGHQNWWPADTPFEVVVGAILTQQATWLSVEKAIKNLKTKVGLTPKALATAELHILEECIKSTGFYRQKAKRLSEISNYFYKNYGNDTSMSSFFDSRSLKTIRDELLSLDGIGPETADSILLYAGNKLILPIDAYTLRLLNRLGYNLSRYKEAQNFLQSKLPNKIEVYKEFHALVVNLCKNNCKIKPSCSTCPLKNICSWHRSK